MISENARRAAENVGWHLEPPFFETRNPKGAPLPIIEPKIQWCTVISLTLALNASPTSKYKVKGRKMVVRLAEDSSLSLRRDDQTTEYGIDWSSGNIKERWGVLRSEFLKLCNARPEMAESIQTSMLQFLLSCIPVAPNDTLQADIQGQWMAVQHVPACEVLEVAPQTGPAEEASAPSVCNETHSWGQCEIAAPACYSDVEVESIPSLSVRQQHGGLVLDTVPRLALRMEATCLDDMDACIDG